MESRLYEELWRTENRHWWFVARRQIVTALVERYAAPPSEPWRICELGCGTGGNLAVWADQHDVVGVDASEHALEFARRRLGERVVYGRLPGPLPLAASSFDVVLSTDVFEHIEDDRSSVAAAIELLKPGGVLVATVPAYQWLYSPRDRHHHHFRRYGKQQFADVLKQAGSRIELLSHYNSFLFPAAAAARLCSKWRAGKASLQDVRVPNGPLNRLLTSVFASERHLLGRLAFPYGLSLVAVVRRLASGATSQAA